MIRITKIKQFNSQLKKILENIEENDIANDMVSSLAVTGFSLLQRRTPVKTGYARGGWNNTVDASPSDWKPKAGSTKYTEQKFKDKNKIKYDSVVNMSNNIEYIVPLENGHSKQAAGGIVNPTFTALNAKAREIRSKLDRKVYK